MSTAKTHLAATIAGFLGVFQAIWDSLGSLQVALALAYKMWADARIDQANPCATGTRSSGTDINGPTFHFAYTHLCLILFVAFAGWAFHVMIALTEWTLSVVIAVVAVVCAPLADLVHMAWIAVFGLGEAVMDDADDGEHHRPNNAAGTFYLIPYESIAASNEWVRAGQVEEAHAIDPYASWADNSALVSVADTHGEILPSADTMTLTRPASIVESPTAPASPILAPVVCTSATLCVMPLEATGMQLAFGFETPESESKSDIAASSRPARTPRVLETAFDRFSPASAETHKATTDRSVEVTHSDDGLPTETISDLACASLVDRFASFDPAYFHGSSRHQRPSSPSGYTASIVSFGHLAAESMRVHARTGASSSTDTLHRQAYADQGEAIGRWPGKAEHKRGVKAVWAKLKAAGKNLVKGNKTKTD